MITGSESAQRTLPAEDGDSDPGIVLKAGQKYEFVWSREEIESRAREALRGWIELRLKPVTKITTRQNADGTYTHIYDFTERTDAA